LLVNDRIGEKAGAGWHAALDEAMIETESVGRVATEWIWAVGPEGGILNDYIMVGSVDRVPATPRAVSVERAVKNATVTKSTTT